MAIASLVIVIAVAGAAIVWWPSQEQVSTSAPTPTITRLTSYSGLTTDAALSPDGTLLAYASDRGSDGNLDIWLQQIGQAEAIRLTSDLADDREPAFSPDGRRIVFRSERDGGGVYIVSTLGGAASRIAAEGRQPRFSPDGKLIAYWVGLTGRVADSGTRTYVVGANGGSPTQVASDLRIARHPLWTPDGTHLLVLGSSEATADLASRAWDWWVTSFDGGPSRRTGAFDVLRSHSLLGNLPIPSAWDEERGILFAADLGDTRNIWQLRLAPGEWRASEAPHRLTSGAAIEDLPAAAADRVAFSSFIENTDIWSLPVDTLRGRVTGPVERLTDNVGVDVQPALSADGRRVAFTSNRAGNYDVYAKDLVTGEETAITISPTFESRPAISADGSMIAYNEGPATRRRVHVSSLGDPSGPVGVNVCDDCFVPWDWSLDNKYLLFWPQTRRTIAVLDVRSRRSAIILAQDKSTLLRASFSPDNRWIVFLADVAFDRSQTFIAPFRDMSPIERTSWIEVSRPEEAGWLTRWSPDGNALYLLSNYDGYYCLWRQNLDPVTKRPVGTTTAVHHMHSARRLLAYIAPGFVELSVARDRIVFPMVERTGNLWMAEWKR